MKYTTKIHRDDLELLLWLADRGYDGRFYETAELEREPTDEDPHYIYTHEEHKAWEVAEEVQDDPCAFLACAASERLIVALTHFVDSIV